MMIRNSRIQDICVISHIYLDMRWIVTKLNEMTLSVSLHRFFWIGKIYRKHRKWYEFCTNSQDRNHQEYQCTRKSRVHKIPYQNPYILYKNLKNTNLSQITPNTTKILKSHQTPPKHSNHTKDSQTSYVSHNSSPNIWVGQDHPKIVGREIFG